MRIAAQSPRDVAGDPAEFGSSSAASIANFATKPDSGGKPAIISAQATKLKTEKRRRRRNRRAGQPFVVRALGERVPQSRAGTADRSDSCSRIGGAASISRDRSISSTSRYNAHDASVEPTR